MNESLLYRFSGFRMYTLSLACSPGMCNIYLRLVASVRNSWSCWNACVVLSSRVSNIFRKILRKIKVTSNVFKT